MRTVTNIAAETPAHVGFAQKVRAPGGYRGKSMSTATCELQLPPDMKPAFTPLRRIGPVVEGGSGPGSTSDMRSGSFTSGRRKSMMDYDKPRGVNSFQTYKKISGTMSGTGTAAVLGSAGTSGSAQGVLLQGENVDETLAALDIGIGYKSPRRGSGPTHSPRVSESEKS